MDLIKACKKTGKASLGRQNHWVEIKKSGVAYGVAYWGDGSLVSAEDILRDDWLPYNPEPKECEACKLLTSETYWDKVIIFLLKKHCECNKED